ncbi:MAG: hypothetical protein U5J98_12055 [Halobacteriales archaeon]|nr:hypothetical protein [Halobacteriales archaeon]
MGLDGLADLPTDRIDVVQRALGVLEDVGDFLAPYAPELGLVHLQEVVATVPELLGLDDAGRRVDDLR